MNYTKEEQHRRMTQTPIPRLVTSMAIPTTCSQLVSTIYNTADTYFVSQIGTSASAAVGVVFSLMSIIQAVGFGIGMGSLSLISPKLGAKKEEEANAVAASSLALAIVFGILLMIFGTLAIEPLMRLLGLYGYDSSLRQSLRAFYPVRSADHVSGLCAEQHPACGRYGDVRHVGTLHRRYFKYVPGPAVHFLLRHGYFGSRTCNGSEPVHQLLYPGTGIHSPKEHRHAEAQICQP